VSRRADARRHRGRHAGALVLAGALLATCVPAWPADDVWRPQVALPDTTGPAGDRFAPRAAPSPQRAFQPGIGAIPPLDAHPYALAELIDLAQSINPDTRIAWNAAREAALAAGIARSAYLPQLSAMALAGHQQNDGQSDALGQSVPVDDRYNGSVAALSLQWLLFDFGRRGAIFDATRQSVVTAQLAFSGAHQRLIHRVSVAFYAYSATGLRTRSSQQSLADAQAIQQAAAARFEHGIGTVVEVAQARQAVAQATLEQVRAAGSREDAYVALLAAIGLPPLTRLQIAEAGERPLDSVRDIDVEQAIETAMTRRPDVLAAYSNLQSSQAGIRLAKAEYLPRLFLFASSSHARGDLSVTGFPALGSNEVSTLNLGNSGDGFSVTGLISVPLFDGGRRRALLSQARVRADSAGTVFDQLKIEAARQIVQAHNDLRTSLQAHRAASELVTAAQTTFDAALAAYRHGVGTATDTLAAECLLLEAQVAAADAYSAALSAAATLALATGTLEAAPPP